MLGADEPNGTGADLEEANPARVHCLVSGQLVEICQAYLALTIQLPARYLRTADHCRRTVPFALLLTLALDSDSHIAGGPIGIV